MKQQHILILLAALFVLASCGEDYTKDYPVPPASLVAEFRIENEKPYVIGTEVQFVNESVVPERFGGASFEWSFGDGTVSSDENPVHEFEEIGMYPVTLKVLASSGDTAAYTVDMDLKDLLVGDTLYFQDFEGINLIPEDIALVNVDGNTPDNPGYATMEDSAWIVYYSGYFESQVAMGNSFYNPEAGADDWMILPQVTASENTWMSWDAMSLTTSGNYPDSYQIYVSTTDQTVEGCQANGVIYRVLDEEVGVDAAESPGQGIQNRRLDLSRFAGDDIYVAFRLMTPDPGGDRLAIDNIAIIDKN